MIMKPGSHRYQTLAFQCLQLIDIAELSRQPIIKLVVKPRPATSRAAVNDCCRVGVGTGARP